MKTKIVASAAAALLVCGVIVYVHASSDVSSTEPSISSTPQAAPPAHGNEGCEKKAECDKMAEEKVCPKSKVGCPKSKEGGDKSEAGCPKITEGCPLSK